MDAILTDPLVGARIAERYRVQMRLPDGGSGTTYTALDQRLDRSVTLKILPPIPAADSRRFDDEVATLAHLTHPHVVAVYDQGRHDGQPFLVLEHVTGRTLRDLLTEHERLRPAEALTLMEQILSALAAAHRAGITHRALTSDNVLVIESEGGELIDAVAKVSGFGPSLAPGPAVDVDHETAAPNDPRIDVYAAGVLLRDLLADPPPAMAALVARATSANIAERPSDAGAMLAEFQAIRNAPHAFPAADASAAPTMVISRLAAPTQYIPTHRPSWARLPSTTRIAPEAPPTVVAPRRTAPHRARREGGLAGWYRDVVGPGRDRQIIGAATAVAVLLAVVAGWWFAIGRYTAAPDLVGSPRVSAAAIATRDGFGIQVGPGRYDERVPRDTVLAQVPAGSRRILKGGTITLTLSLGPERYTVPDENGKATDMAIADLTSIKLVPRQVAVYDDNMPTDHVLSTDPAAGTVVAPGTEILLKVSKGRAPITVPTLTGTDVNAAQAQLQQLGLQWAVKTQQSNQPNNQVIDQNPAAGSGVEKNATVILTISSGPAMVTVPNLMNQGISLDQATKTLQQLGLTVTTAVNVGGQVRQQNPGPGAQVPTGSQVQLWITP